MNITIRAVLLGKRIADRIINENTGYTIVFTWESIGDQCLELAYLREFRKRNNINRIAILTTKPNQALFKYFEGEFEKIIPINQKDFDTLLKFYKSDMGLFYRKKHPSLICAFYTAYIRHDLLFDNPYVSLADFVKMIYRIPKDADITPIKKIDNTEWINKLVNDGIVEPGKTILINPYANSCKNIPMSFFTKLATELKRKGYKIITSVYGSQESVPGTIGLDFPLEKAVSLSESCGTVIGTRSGFLDLVALSDTKVIALDRDDYNVADACILEQWWINNKRLKTFRYRQQNELEVLNDVINFVEEK